MQTAKQKTLWFVKVATMIFVLVFAMAFALFTNVTTTAHADPGEEEQGEELIALTYSYENANDTVEWYNMTKYEEGWAVHAGTGDITLVLDYHQGTQIAGTYTAETLSLAQLTQGYAAVGFVSGSCTVSVDGTIIHIVGTFVGNDDKTYNVDILAVDPSLVSEDVELVPFGKVTDASQITADNVGECTFEQAKAWVVANWDDIVAGIEENAYAKIVYTSDVDLRSICFNLDTIPTKEGFEVIYTVGAITDINEIKGEYANGYSIYLCGFESGEEPATHVHDYSSEWTKDENTHWHACQNANCDTPKSDEAAHVFGDDVNETAYYTCSVCGYENETKKTEYEDVQNASSGTVTIGTGILYVGGADIVAAENYTVVGNGGGTAVLSEDENGNSILTLINFSYTGAGYSNGYEGGAIDYRGSKDLIIKLVGNNTITKAGDGSINMSHGIYFHSSDHSLIIDGAGSLTISFADNKSGSLKSNGIFCEPGVFVMNGGTVVSDGGTGSQESLGIFTNRGITFNGGSFTGNGHRSNGWHSYGIYTFGTTTVNGGTVYATAPLDNGSDPSRGIDNSTFIINAGTITAYGKEAFDSPDYYLQFGAKTIYTITAGENEASATEVNSVSSNDKYVRIVAERLQHVHAYSSEWSKDDSKHWHDCTETEGLCDTPKSDEAAHTYGDDINETAYYTCSVCGYENETKKAEYDETQGGEDEEKWEVNDPEVPSVSIEIVGADEIKAENLANIKLEVKVIAEVETQAEEGNYNEIAKAHVKNTEEISFVYDVKLIRKTIDAESGEEMTEEIQPSDIKEGTTIKVTMDIPESLQGKTFKILHIHSANDIEYVSANNYKVIKGGTQVEVEIDRLSEFAFVTAKAGSESDETGEESANHGFCVGWIVFIFAILELLALALFVVLWLGKPEVVIEKCKLTALLSKIALLNLIGLGASGAIFIFALVALICHACAISIISFVLATLILAAFATFFFLSDNGKKVLAKCKDFFVKVGKWCAALWKKIAAKCKEIFAKCKAFVCKIFAPKKDEKKVEKVDEK